MLALRGHGFWSSINREDADPPIGCASTPGWSYPPRCSSLVWRRSLSESVDRGGEGQATARGGGRGSGAFAVEHEHLGETKARHIPVLVAEVVAGLGVRPGGCYLDATVGGGGHTAAILDASAPDGWVLGLDRDAEAVLRARERLSAYGDRVVVEHASYVDLLDVLRQVQRGPLDGVIFDLGFSSWQIEDPARGFSFLQDGPLDMRFDTGHGATAADLVNQLSEDALAQILFDYGEKHGVAG